MSAKVRWLWRSISLLMVLMMAISPVSASPAPVSARPTSQAIPAPAAAQAAPSAQSQAGVTLEQALAKLHPDLRKLAQTAAPQLPSKFGLQVAGGAQEAIMIEVISYIDAQSSEADITAALSPYFMDQKVMTRPALGLGDVKTVISFGRILPSNLLKVASIGRVRTVLPIVLERNGQPDNYPIDQPRPSTPKGPEDWAKLRQQADKLRAGSLPWEQAKAFGDGRVRPQPQDWFEVKPQGPHKAETAWERGFQGQGVTVAVLDDGIDAAHPDLMGTQKIYSSTEATQYNGWPMVFSPISQYLYALDNFFGTTYVSDGYPGIHFADTSATPNLTKQGKISYFSFTPLIDFGTPGLTHTYVISNTMTKSGVVHLGTHPDNDLRDFVWGEKVAVLVTDPHTAGVYDTVYVDVNDDYDFRDEKPLTRADTTNASTLAATYNDMISYRDMNGDGLADLSGGMLYFIGDGANQIPVSDWLWGMFAPAPGNGDLVAFSGGTFDRDYSHGTQCASNIVGQGVTTGLLPSFADLPPGPGTPPGAVFGQAPEAKVVNVSDIYFNFDSSKIDGYTFAAVGYDGIISADPSDTDAIQITSNSYGSSDQDNDGWDFDGQYVSEIQRFYAPNTQFMFSTGNGAPAYGTTTPPSPDTAIGVGASTEFGSTGWDTITETTQIMNNDVIPFSNRGPTARGTNGVDVVAGGAYAAGAEALNYYSISTWGQLNGNLSWDSWGGTSRSAPVATGILALIYQAYKQANGDWPTFDVAKELLKSSSTDLNYDTFTQGSGSVNADRGTAVAAGLYGVYASPDEWDPGDYRGTDYPAFAHLVSPGDSFTQTFTVNNPGADPVMVDISDGTPTQIGSTTFTYTITPQMFAAKSPDNFYKAPQWIIPITATASKIAENSWWDNIEIPANADLMIVRMRYPYSQYDANDDYNWDNRFRLTVYNWKDVNGNGKVWTDTNGDGDVTFTTLPQVTQIDGGSELDWNTSEVERWEYGRFGYNRPGGNVLEMWVHDPLQRMIDGLFIGLQQYDASSVEQTDFTFQIDFYSYQNVPWLSTSASSINVPAGGSATFDASVNVPADMPTGEYQAELKLVDSGTVSYTAHTTVIPVSLSVAEDFTDGMQLGGEGANAQDANMPYKNGAVRGLFDWTWRAESGDWRFFFSDIPDGSYPDGTNVLVQDVWNDVSPHTDIDTVVLGPSPSELGTGLIDFPDPAYYGPYVLDTVGKSPNTNASAGIWTFDTSSGGNEDWVSAPIQDGLHEFLQHNVLFEGDQFWVPFTKTLGTLRSFPDQLEVSTYADQGTAGTVSVTATLPLNGLVADAFGLGRPEHQNNVPLPLDGWTQTFTVTHAAKIELFTSSPDISDIDLYLYMKVGSDYQPIASSAGGTADEHVLVQLPPDGEYLIFVDNFSGPAGHFDLTKIIPQGNDLTVSGLPSGAIPANTPVSFNVNFNKPMDPGETYQGLLLYGPPEAPALNQVPVIIHRLAALEKTVDKPVAFPGDDLNYTLTITQPLSPDMFNLVDPIPANTTFVDASSNATYDAANNRITFSGTLTDTETITMTVHISDTVASGTWITNTASLTSSSLFTGTVTASATTHIGSGEFATSHKEATPEAGRGDPITYEVHVVNSGDKLVSLTLTDPIPAGTTYLSHNTAPPYQHFMYNAALNQMEWTGNVAPGEEWIFTFQVTIDDDVPLGTVITNTATLDWEGNTMDLTATTTVVVNKFYYLPIVFKQAPSP